jgi:PmbA protein
MTIQNRINWLIDEAKKRNIQDVEVFYQTGESFSVDVRQQKIENIENSIEKGIGLRLFSDGKTSFTHSTDDSKSTLEIMLEKAIENLKSSDVADYNLLPKTKKIEKIDLKKYNPEGISRDISEKIESAQKMEQIILENAQITNSNGASYSESLGKSILANSNGLFYEKEGTSYSKSVSPVAGKGDEMQSNYWYSAHTDINLLEQEEKIAKKAIERTTRLLGAKKAKTGSFPIVFENLMAQRLFGIFVSALNGNSVFRKQSFLANKLNEIVAADFINLVEDPFISGNFSSSYVDSEGFPTQKQEILKNGELKTFLHNFQSATKMKTVSTGNARRSYASAPYISASNIILENSENSVEKLISDAGTGLYLTGLMGSNINPITGDISQGAEGLWIENGKISYSVNEITIAGNILDILKNIRAVANDRDERNGVSIPALLVEGITISGE